jgi:two-component system sensor histidine kinase AlgZ
MASQLARTHRLHMKNPEILSTLDWPATQAGGSVPATGPRRQRVFDACHVGVVLRAVLFVQAVVAVGVMFVAPNAWAWWLDMAAFTAVTQPAVLAWLVAGCALSGWLGRWPLWAQVGAGLLLGALAGGLAMALATWLALLETPRWLAAGLGGGLLAGVLVAGLVWRTRAQAPASTQARLVELQSRIRPHFLFNTLNSAIALVRAEPARAEALLEDLSELFRSALADTQADTTLAQELQLAQRYLAIEQVRFGDRLRLTWSLDPLANAARLPPLLLQPLVENAVKHGVEPSLHGADVAIATQRRGSKVLIKVSNSVPAGTGQPGMGLALANVRERLDLMHDLQATFRAAQVDGQFVVRLEVPA